MSVSTFLACEPLFPGGIYCSTLYCIWGKDRRPFSVCQPINFKERTGFQISTGVPQASHSHRSSLLLVCIWSPNSLGSWFHFLPCAQRELLYWFEGGASLGIWRAKDGVRSCSKQLFPKFINSWPWQGFMPPLVHPHRHPDRWSGPLHLQFCSKE